MRVNMKSCFVSQLNNSTYKNHLHVIIMDKKSSIPDAWDDDWESQIDKLSNNEKVIKLTKAERLANHAETNKKIWKSAEEPETFHFLAAHDQVPLKSEYKPALKVLSRQPVPLMIKQIDPVTGVVKLKLGDDEKDEEKIDKTSPQEIRQRALREREEKQKRYDLARARILGTSSISSSLGETIVYQNSKQERSKLMHHNERSKGNGRDNKFSGSTYNSGSVPRDSKATVHKSSVGYSSPKSQGDFGIIRVPRGPDFTGKPGFDFTKKGER
ncbi:hypothetical protein Golomagni_03505 [Golovinomyces magnicellulatus]|nr:hypothetical protein Golomagni_03505 [Golovinomyces magnicellulatus]